LPQVLLVDDNPADVVLAREALARGRHQSCISNVGDGEEAMAFLRRAGRYANTVRPDLVILDLNLPKKDGRAVLAEAKADTKLRTIPVVVFSTSRSMLDITRSYDLGANCYVSKPGNLDDYLLAVQSIEEFWFGSASLPREEKIMEHEAAHVLLIEDNPGDADLVRLRLVESKSAVLVNCVPRLSDALACLDVETPAFRTIKLWR